jgi:cyclase family protein
MNKTIFLSYILDSNTPSYGNRNKFIIKKKSSIENDDVANDSFISTTVHIGTHIDMPYHFYEDGQTIDDFSADFWIFLKEEILFLEIDTSSIELAIKDVLLRELKNTKDRLGEFVCNYRLLIVKTGICNIREKEEFWSKNFGFHPDIYNYLIENFPNVKVFGFDSISVSSFSNRMLGREAHKRFLNPNRPILLLEDMDLRKVCSNTIFQEVIIAPLRIARCDGLPCTVIGRI